MTKEEFFRGELVPGKLRDREGTDREIHVDAKAKNYGRVSVRTRSGYYPRVIKNASNGSNGAGATESFAAGKKQ